MASVIHQGADTVRHLAFQQVFQWISESGYTMAAPAQEIYLNRNPQHPDLHVTEIQIPIRKC
jgi:effector-binding domain-containing protein